MFEKRFLRNAMEQFTVLLMVAIQMDGWMPRPLSLSLSPSTAAAQPTTNSQMSTFKSKQLPKRVSE